MRKQQLKWQLKQWSLWMLTIIWQRLAGRIKLHNLLSDYRIDSRCAAEMTGPRLCEAGCCVLIMALVQLSSCRWNRNASIMLFRVVVVRQLRLGGCREVPILQRSPWMNGAVVFCTGTAKEEQVSVCDFYSISVSAQWHFLLLAHVCCLRLCAVPLCLHRQSQVSG